MAEETTAKLEKGTWANLETDKERKPRIEFTIGETVTVTFPADFEEPREYGNDRDGVYYLFPCIHNGQEKVIITSAWTLLRGLKEHMPLANKTLAISKEMEKGKQNFTVSEVEGSNGMATEKAA